MSNFSKSPRVLHVGDISGTSRNVIQVAKEKGLDWELHEVPAGRGASPLRIGWSRLRDLFTVRTLRPKPDILHINYGVSGYYGWGRRNVVLHLHGTDVRSDLWSRFLGPIVRWSIKSSDKVLYSTPDMAADVLKIRTDAQWFPAPLPLDANTEVGSASKRSGHRVFFASRWDESKGAPELLTLANQLQETFPHLELVGLDWGDFADAAKDIGVRLLPLMTIPDFREQMAMADIVVGQVAFGALGLSDLEAMAQARPLVAHFNLQEQYGSEAPLFNTDKAPAIELISTILADPAAAESIARQGREWALRHHGASTLESRLEALYNSMVN